MKLYLYKMSHEETGETFHKLGVSNNPEGRFTYGETRVVDSALPLKEKLELVMTGKKYLSDHPYQTVLLHTVDFKFEGEAYLQERELLSTLKPQQYSPEHAFSGRSECFTCSPESLNQLIATMNQAEAEARTKEPNLLQYRLAQTKVKTSDPIKRHIETLAELEAMKNHSQNIGK